MTKRKPKDDTQPKRKPVSQKRKTQETAVIRPDKPKRRRGRTILYIIGGILGLAAIGNLIDNDESAPRQAAIQEVTGTSVNFSERFTLSARTETEAARPTNTQADTPTNAPTNTLNATQIARALATGDYFTAIWQGAQNESTVAARINATARMDAYSRDATAVQAEYIRNGETAPKYYTNGSARLRTCAQTTENCRVVTTLAAGEELTVFGQEYGERVSGSIIWHVVLFEGELLYLHSSLVSETKPVVNQAGSSNSGSSVTRQAPTQSTTGGSQNVSTAPPPPTSPATNPPPQYICGGDLYNCGDFPDCATVTEYFNRCPGDPSRLDGDNNGIPCHSLCL